MITKEINVFALKCYRLQISTDDRRPYLSHANIALR